MYNTQIIFQTKPVFYLRTTLHYHEKGSRISCQLSMSRKGKKKRKNIQTFSLKVNSEEK